MKRARSTAGRSRRRAGLAPGRARGALVIVALPCILAACASIAVNRAMERVHYRYLELFSRVDIGDRAAIPPAAQALVAALDDPVIERYASEVSYQESLQATVDAVRELGDAAARAPGDGDPALSGLRKKVFRSCAACHEVWRDGSPP